MQLDLFLDGRETILVNDLVAALLEGRLQDARDALNRLRKENPAHPDLVAFDRLVRSVSEQLLAPSTGEPGPIIAWLALRHRWVAHVFRPDDVPDAAAPLLALRLLPRLLVLENQRFGDELVRQRKALRDISPKFFQTYRRLEVDARTHAR
jgi:hypothetical protein